MKLPKIDLKELEERKQENLKERREFTKNYAKKIREQEILEEETHN